MPIDPNSPIVIDPNTLQTTQTVFDGTQNVDTTSAPNPAAGMVSMLQNASTSQISGWFQQAQAMIESNPSLAALLGLGVLIIAVNSGQKRK